MLKILRYLLCGFLIFVVLTVLAFVYLKWWQALIVVLAMIVTIAVSIRYLIKNLGKMLTSSMIKMFEVKSQVLRDAEIDLHSVVPVTKPAEREALKNPLDECTDDSEEPAAKSAATPALMNHYSIDVTIKPKPVTGPMSHWDLSDLRMVSSDTPQKALKDMDDADGTEGYDFHDVKVMTNGEFGDDDQGKYEGPQHIRVTVGVPPHVRELKFQYYAEQFGRVPLPPPLPSL
jgi:hypothetical protein